MSSPNQASARAACTRTPGSSPGSRFYNGFYLQGDRSTTYAERAADCKLARLRRRGRREPALAFAGDAAGKSSAAARNASSAPPAKAHPGVAPRQRCPALAVRSAIAFNNSRRWPIAATPSSFRSSAVSSGRTRRSISFSRKASSYRSSPSPRSQPPMSIVSFPPRPCSRRRGA